MAPTNGTQPQLKQKTLLGFFSKGSLSTTSSSKKEASSKSVPKPQENEGSNGSAQKANASSVVKKAAAVKETITKHVESSNVASSKLVVSSSPSHSAKETPPTSDPIDVDMLSDLTEDEIPKSAPTVSKFIVPLPSFDC